MFTENKLSFLLIALDFINILSLNGLIILFHSIKTDDFKMKITERRCG